MKEEFDRGEKGRKTKKKITKRKEDGRVNGNSTTNFSCKRAAFFWHTGEFLSTSKYSSCKWKGRKYTLIGENRKGKLRRGAKQKRNIVKAKLMQPFRTI